eukprot:scaffold67475_cov56-Phaeocystis_antarctica.AAC.2
MPGYTCERFTGRSAKTFVLESAVCYHPSVLRLPQGPPHTISRGDGFFREEQGGGGGAGAWSTANTVGGSAPKSLLALASMDSGRR